MRKGPAPQVRGGPHRANSRAQNGRSGAWVSGFLGLEQQRAPQGEALPSVSKSTTPRLLAGDADVQSGERPCSWSPGPCSVLRPSGSGCSRWAGPAGSRRSGGRSLAARHPVSICSARRTSAGPSAKCRCLPREDPGWGGDSWVGGARLARGPVWETRRDTAALPEEGEPSGETLLKATHRPPGTQEADVHGASGSDPGGVSLGPGHPGPHS